jgi:hypothetical protein
LKLSMADAAWHGVSCGVSRFSSVDVMANLL